MIKGKKSLNHSCIKVDDIKWLQQLNNPETNEKSSVELSHMQCTNVAAKTGVYKPHRKTVAANFLVDNTNPGFF